MKNLLRFLGITALVAVIGFTAASCSDGGGSGPGNPGGGGGPGVQKPVVPLKETYVSYDADGNEYKLVITEVTAGRALDPNKKYTYSLTITFVNGTKATSTGTVAAKDINIVSQTNSIEITLTHSSGQTIIVTVSGSDDSDTGAFTFDSDNESGTIPVDSNSAVKDVPIVDLPYSLTKDRKGWIITSGKSFVKDGVADLPATFRNLPVVGIGDGAFYANLDLKSVTIPASVTFIDNGAFGNWGKEPMALETVTFAPGSQLKTIGNSAFVKCAKLTSITIPDTVTHIGQQAFRYCTGLTSITIPASVTSIGETVGGEFVWGTFAECTNLTTVTFASDSKLETIGVGTFSDCTSLKSIEIPASVTFIGLMAFNFCTSIPSIEIPASVTSFGWGPFANWTAQQTINIYHANRTAASAAWGGDGWLGDCGANIKYWNGSEFLEFSYELTDDGTGYRVINGPRRGAVNIPATYNGKSVTEIGDEAFRDTTGITGVTIPASVKKIGFCAFFGCTNLSTVTFAAGSQLETFEYCAFGFCTSLTSITIPENVSSTETTFYGSVNLTSITIAAGNPYLTSENGIVYNNDRTQLIAYPSASGNVTILNGVTEIVGTAFRDCKNLIGVTIPASVTSIGFHVFIACTNINSITIPESVAWLGGEVFGAWTSSQTIYIQGHPNRASTIAAGWAEDWDKYCDAKIIYRQ